MLGKVGNASGLFAIAVWRDRDYFLEVKLLLVRVVDGVVSAGTGGCLRIGCGALVEVVPFAVGARLVKSLVPDGVVEVLLLGVQLVESGLGINHELLKLDLLQFLLLDD